jgi:hypothetical protein
MSRLAIPISGQVLWATGDVRRWVELHLLLRDNAGNLQEDRTMSDQAPRSGSFQKAVEARKDLLKQEWRTFQRERDRLLAEGHKGHFALVKGDEVVGVWPDEDGALTAGYERFGVVSFMVQPILAEEDEPVYRISPLCDTWPF